MKPQRQKKKDIEQYNAFIDSQTHTEDIDKIKQEAEQESMIYKKKLNKDVQKKLKAGLTTPQ